VNQFVDELLRELKRQILKHRDFETQRHRGHSEKPL
jgi:ribosomal protein S21